MPVVEWSWLIIGAWLALGVGGGSFLTSYLVWLRKGGRYETLARWGAFSFLILTALAILLFIIELERPLGVPPSLIHPLNVFRNPGSTLTWGAGVLTASFIVAVLMSVMWQARWPKGVFNNTIWTIAALIALGLVFYPGFTLAFSDGTVFWRSPFMPWLILANAVTGGIYLITLLQTRLFATRPEEEILRTLLNWGKWLTIALAVFLIGHIIYAFILETSYLGAAFGTRVLLAGRVAPFFWILAIVLGLAVPLLLSFYARRLRGAALENAGLAISLTRLVGVVFILYSLVTAGQLPSVFPLSP